MVLKAVKTESELGEHKALSGTEFGPYLHEKLNHVIGRDESRDGLGVSLERTISSGGGIRLAFTCHKQGEAVIIRNLSVGGDEKEDDWNCEQHYFFVCVILENYFTKLN